MSTPLRSSMTLRQNAWRTRTLPWCVAQQQRAMALASATRPSSTQLPLLLDQLGRKEHADMLRHAQLSASTTVDPGVPVHCIFGGNVATYAAPLRFLTRDALELSNSAAAFVLDDGDGTVDLPSLEICERWPSTVRSYRIKDVSHADVRNAPQLVDIIEALALNRTESWQSWTSPTREALITSGANVAPIEQLFVAPIGKTLG
eukprot:NODE_253_length_3282_cov_4.407924.p3 GENE.NODE_253_length_3282_cov_4.407924~~NODE_253_length_3282_cov_4.407924.p3  ORF type:complete len:203 (-),score=45.54 NODE_253_length_3282_cov_4.407924:201-809(-)